MKISPTEAGLRREGGFGQRDVVSEVFEPPDMVAGDALGVEAVEEVFSQFVIVAVVFEHVVEDGQDRVGDGDDSPFFTAARVAATAQSTRSRSRRSCAPALS